MPQFDAQAESPVLLGTGDLSIEQVIRVARYGAQVAEVGTPSGNTNADEAFRRLEASRTWVEEELAKKTPRGVYGINTGFGIKATQVLSKHEIPEVSRNLIVSHSAGVGDYLHPEIVRAAMVIRANSLALGYSGVRPIVVNTLVRALNRGVCPAVPEYGSLGSSGDLAPLSHLALALSQQPPQMDPLENLPSDYEDETGLAYFDKSNTPHLATARKANGIEYALVNARVAMQVAQIEPLILGAKEGIALNNGAAFSTAIAALALHDSENIVRHAEIATALSLEALLGFRDAFLPQIHAIRRHAGHAASARIIYALVKGSTLLDGDENQNPRRLPPQDPYSLRVAPQVIGSVREVLEFVRRTLTKEINSATDNPLIFPEHFEPTLERDYRAVSGGNFQGTPIGYAMDFVRIALADLGGLCERRIFRLTDDKLNRGLPLMLIKDAAGKEGQTSGMMVAQYLAAALVSECKTLAHPDSVDSIPTSANQEDVVSMSMNAARHTRQVAENIAQVVSIELLCAYLGINSRLTQEEGKPGVGTQTALDVIDECLYSKGNALPRLGIGPTARDIYLRPYLLRMNELLKSGSLVRQVYARSGLSLHQNAKSSI